MKSLVLCSDPDVLRQFLPSASEPVHYLILDESKRAREIHAMLGACGKAVELPKAELYRERVPRFQSSYVSAMGSLNSRMASVHWWAMPFTTKNPISTTLCRDSFEFVLIAELSRRLDGTVIIVTQNYRVAAEVWCWGLNEQIRVTNMVRPERTWAHILHSSALISIPLLIMRALWFRLLSGDPVRKLGPVARGGTLIVTLVHPHSITTTGEFRDTYFCDLSKRLAAWHVPVLIAGHIQGLSRRLAKQFANGSALPSLALDAVLTVSGIVRCGLKACTLFLKRGEGRVDCEVDGWNISGLLRSAIEQAHGSGDVFRSIFMFESARLLSSRFQLDRCLYPYENRAWEKMLLLGIRAGCARTRMVGYNHASITGSHTNFMLRDQEPRVTPLPDVLLTMGQVTRDWFESQGQYPPSMLKVSCALRQSTHIDCALKARAVGPEMRLLVVLATNLLEYIGMLRFLDQALSTEKLGGDWVPIFRIRPHPTLRLEEALQLLAGGNVGFKFEVSSGSAAEDFDWADAVLYASSTMGLEGIRRGIPAVYVDLGDILNTDPMDGWEEFKWIARRPCDLGKIVSEIQVLTDAEYSARQRSGRSYAESYLYPVTDERLRAFQEA